MSSHQITFIYYQWYLLIIVSLEYSLSASWSCLYCLSYPCVFNIKLRVLSLTFFCMPILNVWKIILKNYTMKMDFIYYLWLNSHTNKTLNKEVQSISKNIGEENIAFKGRPSSRSETNTFISIYSNLVILFIKLLIK